MKTRLRMTLLAAFALIGGCKAGGSVCADPANSNQCATACPTGETCFTGVHADGPVPDGRCHVECDVQGCPLGTECVRVRFFGCGDFDGFPDGKAICRGPGDKCR